jgi:hypothetical protein
MELWQLVTGLIITAAAIVTAMKTLTAPIKKKLDELTATEKRVQKLESWTEKQQNDLLDMSTKLTLTFDAALALLDHAIVMQNGNGKCHEAQENMEAFMRTKLSRLSSYREEK